jgi:putative salt-induced outer membrane protein
VEDELMTRYKHVVRHSSTFLWLAMATAAHAEWKGSTEAGFVSARGNTHTDSANGKLDLANQLETWKHALYIAGLYGSTDSISSANRWETRWQSDYKITDPLYWFGGLRYERDHFGAFSYQESAATGVGYKFIDNAATKLNGQVGFGIKKSEEQTLITDESDRVIDRVEGETATRGLITLGGNLEHALTPTTKIVDKLLVEMASDNTLMQNDLALQVAINDSFSLSVGYGIRQNTSPPPGAERTDTITTLNLVYKLQ